MNPSKHLSKPARQKLLKLCVDPKFKERVNDIRIKWGINTRAYSFEEANKYRADQRFRQDLEQLCQDFSLPPDMWDILSLIVLHFDLDNIAKVEDIKLPLPAWLLRTYLVEGRSHFRDKHLYLDVTFAAEEDVHYIWKVVKYWQEKTRPDYIKRGLLPDLLEDIKPGRPPIPDDVCLECVRLKDDERWTYKKIGQHFDWELQVSGYTKQGKGKIRSRCRTAEEAVKRGRRLRQSSCT